jgi:hypothetical protein
VSAALCLGGSFFLDFSLFLSLHQGKERKMAFRRVRWQGHAMLALWKGIERFAMLLPSVAAKK